MTQEVKRVVAKEAEGGMGWEVEVDGQTWRWPSWEMMVQEVSRMVGACVVEAEVGPAKVQDWTRS